MVSTKQIVVFSECYIQYCQGCAPAEPGGSLCLTLALGQLENLTFFVQILCLAPWILQVQGAGIPSIFLRGQPQFSMEKLYKALNIAHDILVRESCHPTVYIILRWAFLLFWFYWLWGTYRDFFTKQSFLGLQPNPFLHIILLNFLFLVFKFEAPLKSSWLKQWTKW